MKLALDNHIRFWDGGESAVEWVYFSRGQEALKYFFYNNRIVILPVIKQGLFSRYESAPSPLPTDFQECTVTGPTLEGTCP